MALIATPSAIDANSYATLAEAETYQAARLYNDEWVAATDPVKETVLQWATRLIDEEYEWLGDRAVSEQALAWPRSNVSYDGIVLSNLLIPVLIRNATCELALFLLKGDRSTLEEPANQGLDALEVGPISLEFSDTDRAELIPLTVSMVCERLSVNTVGMARLTRA